MPVCRKNNTVTNMLFIVWCKHNTVCIMIQLLCHWNCFFTPFTPYIHTTTVELFLHTLHPLHSHYNCGTVSSHLSSLTFTQQPWNCFFTPFTPYIHPTTVELFLHIHTATVELFLHTLHPLHSHNNCGTVSSHPSSLTFTQQLWNHFFTPFTPYIHTTTVEPFLHTLHHLHSHYNCGTVSSHPSSLIFTQQLWNFLHTLHPLHSHNCRTVSSPLHPLH